MAFNDSAEEKTTIDDISLDNAASHYEYLSKEAQAKILNNHNVVSPMIVGITTESSGFSSNGDEIEGCNILLVDDILDTGRTMHALKNELLARGASQVKTCVFLDKPSRRELHLEPDFRVFEVQNEFVVGYGLDFAGRYRNLPYVGALKPAVFECLDGEKA